MIFRFPVTVWALNKNTYCLQIYKKYYLPNDNDLRDELVKHVVGSNLNNLLQF